MPPWVRLALALLALACANEETGHGLHEAAEADAEAAVTGEEDAAGDSHAVEGEHEQGGHGETEEAPSSSNLSVSAMLLGSVVFNMSIFYLVNHRDKDIKMHSWAVVSSTIAIFVSVLVFNGMQGVIDGAVRNLIPSQALDEEVLVAMRYLQFVLWYAVMYITLISQAKQCVAEEEKKGASEAEELDVQQKMTCWSTLFAHMAGFAAMSGGSSLQSYGKFGEVPLLSFVPVLITAAIEFFMFHVVDSIVEAACKDLPAKSVKLVDEYGDEAETEIGGLSLSYLTVQTLTFLVTGAMPHHGGHHSGAPPPEPIRHSVMLVLLALAFVFMTGLTVYISSKVGVMTKVRRRWLPLMETVVAMCFAWCLLHAFQWEVSRFLQRHTSAGGIILDPTSTVQRVLLALSVSFVSITMIFALDYLHDLDATGALADNAIFRVTMAIGILIGFSWEEAFNAGCDCFAQLASSFWGTIMIKLALGLTVAVVVVPAWRHYILRNLLLLEKQNQNVNRGPPPAEHKGYTSIQTFDKAAAPMTPQSAQQRAWCCGLRLGAPPPA